jgi:hypothetical protein
MNNQNENLKELFEKYLSGEQAEQAVKDIQKGEGILHKHPAAEPDDTLIADIKAEISRVLIRQKAHSFRRTFYKMAAVAAAVIIVTTVSFKLFERSGSIGDKKEAYTATAASAVWGSENSDDDSETATLKAEIEQTAQEVSALQLNENNGNGRSDIMDLEMELIEIDSEFWKG